MTAILNLAIIILFARDQIFLFHWLLLCLRLEVLAFQYDTDKKEKLSKWETWKIKLKAIIVMRQDSLAKLKSHESPGPLRNVEEQLAVAEVSFLLTTLFRGGGVINIACSSFLIYGPLSISSCNLEVLIVVGGKPENP